ncbi:MAG: ATP-binding protein [Candidatus Paceibacterota bacterium]
MKINLSIKIISIVFLIFFIFSAILSYASLKIYNDDLTTAFLNRAKATAYSLESNISNKKDLKKEKLLSIIQKHIWLDPDIIDIAFNLSEGKNLITFISNNQARINQIVTSDNDYRSFNENIIINEIIKTNTLQTMELTAPIHVSGQIIGTVQIYFTLENMEEQINSALKNLIIIYITTTFLCFLFLAFYLRRIVIRPVLEIKKGVELLSKGNLDEKVKIFSGDELGSLAIGFNVMALRLKESYEKLKKEQSRLISSIDNLPLGFMIVDLFDNTVIVNPMLKKIFGLPSESSALQYISQKLEDKLDLQKEYEKIILEKKPIIIKEILFNERYFQIILTPIYVFHNQNEIIGTIFLFEDITEQKMLDQAKNNFIAIASHEMRTPLTIIRGNAELILESLKTKALEKDSLKIMLSSIHKNSIRLLDILHDFIDVVFLEESKIPAKKEQFDVNKLTQEIVADFQELAKEKNLSLKIDFPSSLSMFISADQNRFRQILNNVISNAIYYTEAGGINIGLEKYGNFAKISVSDTGIGISPENQLFIFKKFGTIKKTFLKSKEYGSGLGLYIAKMLAKSMDGDLKLEKSEVGKGSTFSVFLPLAS